MNDRLTQIIREQVLADQPDVEPDALDAEVERRVDEVFERLTGAYNPDALYQAFLHRYNYGQHQELWRRFQRMVVSLQRNGEVTEHGMTVWPESPHAVIVEQLQLPASRVPEWVDEIEKVLRSVQAEHGYTGDKGGSGKW